MLSNNRGEKVDAFGLEKVVVFKAHIDWESGEPLQFVKIDPTKISCETDSVYIGRTSQAQLVRNGIDSHIFNRPAGNRGKRKKSDMFYAYMPFFAELKRACGFNVLKHQFTISGDGNPTIFMIVYATKDKAARPPNSKALIEAYLSRRNKSASRPCHSPTDLPINPQEIPVGPTQTSSPEVDVDEVEAVSEVDEQAELATDDSLPLEETDRIDLSSQVAIDETISLPVIPVLNERSGLTVTDGVYSYDVRPSRKRTSEFLESFAQQVAYTPEQRRQILMEMENSIRYLRQHWSSLRQELETRSMGNINCCFNVSIKVDRDVDYKCCSFLSSNRLVVSNENKGDWLVLESDTTIKLILEAEVGEGLDLMAKILQLQPGFREQDLIEAIQDDLAYGSDLSLKDGQADREFPFQKSGNGNQFGALLIKFHSPTYPSETLGAYVLPVSCK